MENLLKKRTWKDYRTFDIGGTMKTKQKAYLEDLIARYPVLNLVRSDIERAYKILESSYSNNGKLLIAGNGGSAADAQHIVGELMKGFIKKRRLPQELKEKLIQQDEELGKWLAESLQQPLPAIAVTGQEALSTAYLNDVDGTAGFAQQVLGYGNSKDVLLGITTSGNSKNIIYSAMVAKAKGMKVIALTGRDGGKIKELADISVIVPAEKTYQIQEFHLPIYHTWCLMLEEKFFDEE